MIKCAHCGYKFVNIYSKKSGRNILDDDESFGRYADAFNKAKLAALIFKHGPVYMVHGHLGSCTYGSVVRMELDSGDVIVTD